MKILKYFIIMFFAASMTDAQSIHKDGKEVKTFTYDEALKMLKARDSQWEGKIEKADSLIASQKNVIGDYEDLIVTLEKSANVDSLLLSSKDSQIKLLNIRDETNEKLIQSIDPKWYENTYLWLVMGFVLGKI